MAIKKTSQLVAKTIEDTNSQIKAFIHNADKIEGTIEPDPNAVRNFKQLSVRLNEFEYNLLEQYSKKMRRSIADSMRDALIEKIKADINSHS
jgi:hypothetical protein